MIFRKSKYVDLEYSGHPLKFRRPAASVMAGWLPRLQEIARAAEEEDPTFFLDADAITEMCEQIAHHVEAIDGEERDYPADEVNESLTPSEVCSLWALFVLRCQLGDEEKKP